MGVVLCERKSSQREIRENNHSLLYIAIRKSIAVLSYEFLYTCGHFILFKSIHFKFQSDSEM